MPLLPPVMYTTKHGTDRSWDTFAQIAVITLNDLRKQIDVSKGKAAYHSYMSCIEKYFIPYFAERKFEELTHTDIVEFELWRDRQMTRKPKSSTLNNFTSA